MPNAATKAKPANEKTVNQVRAIFGLAKERGLNSETLHMLIEAETGKESIKDLTFSEANKAIQAMGGRTFEAQRAPRRTEQYRRQRTGSKQIATKEQFTLIGRLASQRNWTPESMVSFCQRTIRTDRPKTTKQANVIIEALKAMNTRDGLWVPR